MDLLTEATLNGARAMGREHDVGTVTPGKLADLVALDADPLADPRNYQRVRWVMKGGALIPRPR
jgi:imidazolonepropionase-like amidohydrolase